MSKMNTLPVEVLHQICSYLHSDHRDVARYRLVCSRFAAVGIEHIIPTVYVTYHPRSLARLKEISEHPLLRQYVRTVCYLTDTIPIYNDFEVWKERAEEMGNPDFDAGVPECEPPYSDSELNNGWKEYQKCKAGQDELWNMDNDGETFVRSLASLPSLRKVAMYDYYNHGSGSQEGDLFWHHRYPFDETLVADSYDDNDNPGRSFGIKQFFTLLSAMKLCQRSLRSLELTELTWQVFKKLPPVVELKKGLSCLSHLRLHITSLDISYKHDEEFFERAELMSTGCIGRFVASAPNLETIELSFEMDDPDLTDWIYHLPDLLSDQTYSRLRRLALVGVKVSEDSLGTFLQKHAATIKDLELRDCKVTATSTWLDIFTKIPKILDLEEVVLGGYFLGSQGWPSDVLCTWTKIMDSDLRIGIVLEMVVCRNFTRKYGHPCANEEEIRSQILSDIVLGSSESELRLRNTDLMCQLFDMKWDLRMAKLAKQAGYSDPLRYETQVFFKHGCSEDEWAEMRIMRMRAQRMRMRGQE